MYVYTHPPTHTHLSHMLRYNSSGIYTYIYTHALRYRQTGIQR